MHLAKVPREEIVKRVTKTDGAHPKLHAVDMIIKKKKDNPAWHGQASENVGRTEVLSEGQKKQIVDVVFKNRGKAKVTVSFCKKTLPWLRKVMTGA